MWTIIADVGGTVGLVLFVLISLYLFSDLPKGYIKFVCVVIICAAIILAEVYAASGKASRIDFALFIGCLAIVFCYLLLRLADWFTRKEGISIFQKQDEEKPHYFRF